MKTLLKCLIAMAALAAAPVWAAADSVQRPRGDPVVEQVEEAIAAKDWKQAQGILRSELAKSPQNADYHNLFAYTMRMGANPPMDLVFKHYNEALRLDSKHRGAHEYLGEAYLMTGNLQKAKDHLKVLDGLCFMPCKEYTALKKAVADYEAMTAKK